MGEPNFCRVAHPKAIFYSFCWTYVKTGNPLSHGTSALIHNIGHIQCIWLNHCYLQYYHRGTTKCSTPTSSCEFQQDAVTKHNWGKGLGFPLFTTSPLMLLSTHSDCGKMTDIKANQTQASAGPTYCRLSLQRTSSALLPGCPCTGITQQLHG